MHQGAMPSLKAKDDPTTELALLAQRMITQITKKAQSFPALKKKLPLRIAKDGIEVSLVSSVVMQRLNKAWRAKDYPTDVLSFPVHRVFFEQGRLGELVICAPVLKRQAKEQGHPIERELEVLLVHGILHLMGFDHELGGKQATLMRKWEDALLSNRGGLISRSTPAKKKR
jgi:probable rRNA maturation factor